MTRTKLYAPGERKNKRRFNFIDVFAIVSILTLAVGLYADLSIVNEGGNTPYGVVDDAGVVVSQHQREDKAIERAANESAAQGKSFYVQKLGRLRVTNIVEQPPVDPPVDPPPIGMTRGIGLPGLTYWSSMWYDVDAMRWSEYWPDPNNPGFVHGAAFTGLVDENGTPHYPTGEYSVLADGGKGEVRFENGVDGNTFRHVIDGPYSGIVKLWSSGSSAGLRIRIKHDPIDPIQNLRVLMPTFTEPGVHPAMLADLSKFGVIRFMDTVTPNGNLMYWKDRTTPDDPIWSNRGKISSYEAAVTSYVEFREDAASLWNGQHDSIIIAVDDHELRTGVRAFVYRDGVKLPNSFVWGDGNNPIRVLPDNKIELKVRRDLTPDELAAMNAGDMKLRVVVQAQAPYEWCLDLAVKCDATPWICVPAGADDQYIIELIKLCEARGPPGKPIIIEFGNEAWNDGGSAYMPSWTRSLSFGNGKNIGYARWVAWGTAIARQHSDRVQIVACAQAGRKGWAGASDSILNEIAQQGQRVDALGIAPYFDFLSQAGDMSSVDIHKQRADAHGIPLWCYEVGQHILDSKDQDTPEMAAAYEAHIAGLESSGVTLACWYDYCRKNKNQHQWGHKQFQLVTTKKWEAIIK